MEHLDGDDHGRVLREEGKDSEPGGVAEDAEDHRRLPAELGQDCAEERHRDDLRHLADAHHRHDPLRLDPHSRAAEEIASHHEVAVVDHRVDERHDEQHEEIGASEELGRLQPRKAPVTGRRRLRRRVGEEERVAGQHEREHAGNQEDVAAGGDGVGASLPLEDEIQRPGDEDPADRAPHAHEAKLLLGVFHVRKRERVGDGDRRHVEEGVDEHQPKERREVLHEVHAEDRQAANEVAEGEELLRRERPVGELAGEEDADDRSDREGASHPRLLRRGEVEAVLPHVAPDQREPGAPNGELEHHHQPEAERWGFGRTDAVPAGVAICCCVHGAKDTSPPSGKHPSPS